MTVRIKTTYIIGDCTSSVEVEGVGVEQAIWAWVRLKEVLAQAKAAEEKANAPRACSEEEDRAEEDMAEDRVAVLRQVFHPNASEGVPGVKHEPTEPTKADYVPTEDPYDPDMGKCSDPLIRPEIHGALKDIDMTEGGTR